MVGEDVRLITAREKADRAFKALDSDGDNRLTREANPDVFRWQGFSAGDLEDDVITREELMGALQRQELMVARARFNIGQLYENQASDGLYDQTMAGKAMRAYEVFLQYYAEPGDEAAPRA